MGDYYKKILKELKNDDIFDNFDDLSDLINFIKNNNDVTLDDINKDIDDLKLYNIDSCSISINDLFLPTPSGTNFFTIFNPIQAMNSIIPDIFRLCIIKDPKNYQKEIISTRISPKIKISFEDRAQFQAANIITRYQKLIPENIIKAFFYFGYKSDFENFNINSIDYLELKINTYIKDNVSNYSKYTDPETIFNLVYTEDTLIQNMIQLNGILENVKKEKSDLTNIGNYNLPYLFTYYTIIQILINDDLNINKYSNLVDKNTTTLSYSDLVYLNYLNNLISNNLILDKLLVLVNNNSLGFELDPSAIDNLNTSINFARNNNIFILIQYALEVKNYILNVISYNLNKKTYKVVEYAKPSYLVLTKKLYCNYASNEMYNYPDLKSNESCI